MYSNEWQGQASLKIKTEKNHVGPVKSNEELS